MTTVKATVRGGRLELEEPIDLPDGTELLIPLPGGPERFDEGDWDNSPEGIADWLTWYDSLEPLIFTDEERAFLEADRQARREWELAHSDEHAAKLREMWPWTGPITAWRSRGGRAVATSTPPGSRSGGG